MFSPLPIAFCLAILMSSIGKRKTKSVSAFMFILNTMESLIVRLISLIPVLKRLFTPCFFLFSVSTALTLLCDFSSGLPRFLKLLNGEVKTMAEIVSQSAMEHNKDFWFYVVVRFCHGQKAIRRHVHGIEELVVLVSGLSALAPILSVLVEEHTPPQGVK